MYAVVYNNELDPDNMVKLFDTKEEAEEFIENYNKMLIGYPMNGSCGLFIEEDAF